MMVVSRQFKSFHYIVRVELFRFSADLRLTLSQQTFAFNNVRQKIASKCSKRREGGQQLFDQC